MARGPGIAEGAGRKKFDDELKFSRLDRQAEDGRLDRADKLHHRPQDGFLVNPKSGLPVLGGRPGTGVITRQILALGVKPENLYASNIPPISCAICAVYPASTSSRATPSISTPRW